MVGGYEKYCNDCINKFGVKQDENFWRDWHWVKNWEEERKAEFEKDLKGCSPQVSKK